MLLTYVPPTGGKFFIPSHALGLTDADVAAMRKRKEANMTDDFILNTVAEACQRLALVQPVGSS